MYLFNSPFSIKTGIWPKKEYGIKFLVAFKDRKGSGEVVVFKNGKS
jgi:hypothetical protein